MATITVTNENDSGAGSLRAALAAAAPGDIINFGTDVTTINLDSSLVISKGITVDGLQPGSTNPGVTINGGGAGSNFSDFVIDAGVTATFDGLIIQDGHATGAVGANTPLSNLSQPGGQGSAAAGGIYDAGALTLNNSVLQAAPRPAGLAAVVLRMAAAAAVGPRREPSMSARPAVSISTQAIPSSTIPRPGASVVVAAVLWATLPALAVPAALPASMLARARPARPAAAVLLARAARQASPARPGVILQVPAAAAAAAMPSSSAAKAASLAP